ncbi:MAG: HAD-IA family hydrolase [Gemmatimonadaceae bacterium]
MNPPRPFAVLFDLDGTLIDSVGLLLASVKHTFEGRTPAPTVEEWIAGIGTPLAKQLRPYASSEEEAAEFQQIYRVFQREHHDRLTTVFDGVPETLAELDRRGHPMGLVTSKSNEMMERGIRYVGLDRYMKTMIGADSCETHKPDAFPVLLALQELGYNTDEAVFVGDSPHDVNAGNAAKVVSVAALWGPFTREQLAPCKPAHYLDSIRGLPALLDTIQAPRAE